MCCVVHAMRAIFSLRRELFCQVAGPVWVVPQGDRRVIGQSLEGHDTEEGGKCLTRLRHILDARLIASDEFREEVASFRVLAVRDDDGEKVDLIGHQLAHGGERDSFVDVQRVKDDKDGGHARVELHVVEEIVGDVGDAEALAVQVGQLLHLEAALLSNSL